MLYVHITREFLFKLHLYNKYQYWVLSLQSKHPQSFLSIFKFTMCTHSSLFLAKHNSYFCFHPPSFMFSIVSWLRFAYNSDPNLFMYVLDIHNTSCVEVYFTYLQKIQKIKELTSKREWFEWWCIIILLIPIFTYLHVIES